MVKITTLMENAEKANQYFAEGYNCSQSVFTAIAELNGLDHETALKIASGFGGGIARLQKTCGAVTGAVMAIGLMHGHTEPNDEIQKEKVYDLTREFVDRFTQKHKTTECSELLGHNLLTEEDRLKVKELGLFETVCSRCVKDAILIAEEMKLSGR